MSDCRKFEDLLPLHAVEETGLDEALAVEEHLAGCQACREEVVALGELSRSLRRELGPVPPVPESWTAGSLPARPAPLAAMLGLAGWRGLALAASVLAAGILVGRWSAPVSPGMETPAAGVATTATPASRMVAADRRRPPALSVFSPAARRFLSEAAHSKGQATSPARRQP